MATRTARSLVCFTVRRIRNGNPRHARSFRRLHQRVIAALFSLALLVSAGGALVGMQNWSFSSMHLKADEVASGSTASTLPSSFVETVTAQLRAWQTSAPNNLTQLRTLLGISSSSSATTTATASDSAATTGVADNTAATASSSSSAAVMSKSQACQMNAEDAPYLDADSLLAIQKAVGAPQTGTWITTDLEAFNTACGYGDYIDGGRTGTSGYGSGSQVTADAGRDPAKEQVCLEFKSRWLAVGQTAAYADRQYQQCRSNDYDNYVFKNQASKGLPDVTARSDAQYRACLNRVANDDLSVSTAQCQEQYQPSIDAVMQSQVDSANPTYTLAAACAFNLDGIGYLSDIQIRGIQAAIGASVDGQWGTGSIAAWKAKCN